MRRNLGLYLLAALVIFAASPVTAQLAGQVPAQLEEVGIEEHLDAKIPHYHARLATEAVREAFPHLYRYNPTPIRRALWVVAKNCHVVGETDDGWQFTEVAASSRKDLQQAA